MKLNKTDEDVIRVAFAAHTRSCSRSVNGGVLCMNCIRLMAWDGSADDLTSNWWNLPSSVVQVLSVSGWSPMK